MAQLARTPLVLAPETGDWQKDMDAECTALEALQAKADAIPPGQIVGALIRFPRGDGYALYVVTKEKPLTLQWVQFGDRWQTEYITIRGLRRADVQHMVDGERKMRDLFGRKHA